MYLDRGTGCGDAVDGMNLKREPFARQISPNDGAEHFKFCSLHIL